jgi:hypothetical protein|tara:strand:+ start:868 stop:993 length:126 start_codon:yes stop_codon:yes gene_type:complete
MKVKKVIVNSLSRKETKKLKKIHHTKVRNIGKKISKDPTNY